MVFWPNYKKQSLWNGHYKFEKQTHTHTKEREKDPNTKTHHKLNSKVIITFKGEWDKSCYTQHILLSKH